MMVDVAWERLGYYIVLVNKVGSEERNGGWLVRRGDELAGVLSWWIWVDRRNGTYRYILNQNKYNQPLRYVFCYATNV